MMCAFFLLHLFFLVRTAGAACNDYDNCIDCTNAGSWLPDVNCRWCPRDQECHAYGSWVNPCSRGENVKDPSDCEGAVVYKYDEATAVKFLDYAAAAYSDTPQSCLSNVQPHAVVQSTFSEKCDIFTKCFAYVAVNDAEKSIVLAYRGSQTFSELVVEALSAILKPDYPFLSGGSVEAYFYKAYSALHDAIAKIKELHIKHPEYELWVTGHSLGGAIASLASAEVLFTGEWSSKKVKLITFGQPRTGTYYYAYHFDQLVKYSFRVVHSNDIVPHVPWCLQVPFVTCIGFLGFAYHHGLEVWYDNDDMTPGRSSFEECLGKPFHEDQGCSNGIAPDYSTHSHIVYFNKVVTDYGKSGCKSAHLGAADKSPIHNMSIAITSKHPRAFQPRSRLCPGSPTCSCEGWNIDGTSVEYIRCNATRDEFPKFITLDANITYVGLLEVQGPFATIPPKCLDGLASVEKLSITLTVQASCHINDLAFTGVNVTSLALVNFPEVLPLPAGVRALRDTLKGLAVFATHIRAMHAPVFENLKLESLELNSCDLREQDISSEALHGLESYLLELSIVNCGLTDVPTAAIKGLTQLRTLDLSRNNITQLRAGAFDRLAGLKRLVLDGNNIRELNALAFKDSSLSSLSCDNCGLVSFDFSLTTVANKLVNIFLDDSKSLRNIEATSASPMAAADIFFSCGRCGVQHLSSGVERLISQRNATIALLSNGDIDCSVSLSWMYNVIFRDKLSLYLGNSTCAGGNISVEAYLVNKYGEKKDGSISTLTIIISSSIIISALMAMVILILLKKKKRHA